MNDLGILSIKLGLLDDRSIQLFLRNVEMDELVLAYPEFPQKLQDVIRANMSMRACCLMDELIRQAQLSGARMKTEVLRKLWKGYSQAVAGTRH